MGTSEFEPAGPLPDTAADVGVSVATAGALTSAFAVGMIVAAPLVAVLVRPPAGARSGLVGCVLAFLAAHAVGAAAGPLVAATALATGAGRLGPLWMSGLLVAPPFRTVVAAGRNSAELRCVAALGAPVARSPHRSPTASTARRRPPPAPCPSTAACVHIRP